MKTFLRCDCWRKAGKKRTVRVTGCDHKRAFQFRDGGRVLPPIMTPFRDATEAERWAGKYRENYFRRKTGQPTVPLEGDDTTTTSEAQSAGTVRLADLQARFDAWLLTALRPSAQKYSRTVASFVSFVGGEKLLHTTGSPDIERWRTMRRESLAINGTASKVATPKFRKAPRKVRLQTINTNLIALRTFYRQAELWYGFRSPFTAVLNANGERRSPIAKAKIGKGEKKIIVPLSADEVAEAVSFLPDPWGDVCLTTYHILPRLSEVLHLDRSQVGIGSLPDGTQYGWMIRDLKSQEDAERIRIPLLVARRLLARAASLPAGERRLFYTVNPKTASGDLRRLFDKAGRPWSHHWFRHSGITTMKDRGDVNDKAIATLAGWRGTAQLATYNHVSDRAVAHAGDGQAALFEAALKRAQAKKRGRGKVLMMGGAR